jgi:hypothetical protein
VGVTDPGAAAPPPSWPVGPGTPGPLTRQLRELYWASHEDARYSAPVRYDEPD